ncbi:MAG TPA: metal ABC transporter substrate-binding protein [Candidatus Polarisedimenticolia bacterium]|nr:metal ABC transporter substrate-binding protein [Candidatus Polarisedimenticolia bacterium]
MHPASAIGVGLAALLAAPAAGEDPSRPPLPVVATVPNLGSIAAEVGGGRAAVTTIASGVQDAHFVDPKPSFIVTLRRARLLIVNGLDLEIGWVPPLTQGARNPRVLPGGEGYLDVSAVMRVLEVPGGPVSRAQGDVHPYGNPHYMADPLNGELAAGAIAAALSRESPQDAGLFESRRAAFVQRLHEALFGADLVREVGGAKLARLARSGELDPFLAASAGQAAPPLGGWMGRMRPLRGARIVTYHRDYSYFAERFGLVVVDHVEPKPGIPPSARHRAELRGRLKDGGVRLIVTRPYVEHRSTEELSRATGVPVATLPLEVGGHPEAVDYISLFDVVTSALASSAAPARGP